MDASTNQTLANVNITAQIDQNQQQLTTAPDGTFELTIEIQELTAQLTFTTEGYAPYILDIQLIADEILDIGQIRSQHTPRRTQQLGSPQHLPRQHHTR